MFKKLDPKIFIGRKMTLKSIEVDDYQVDIAGHIAGRIFKLARSNRSFVWFWTITGPICVEAQIGSHGDCETIVDARRSFRHAFDQWLSWACDRRESAGWHE